MNRIHRGLVLLLTAISTATAWPQATPLPSQDVTQIYNRLLPQVRAIKIFDHHAHSGFSDDPDVDAQAAPPAHVALRVRDTNPELVAASKSLFGYPYDDFSPPHRQWLVEEKARIRQQYPGTQYFDHILDQLGVEQSVANRVAMAPYLDPARFRWVFFVDSFFFPFDNRQITGSNPDEGVYIPLQEKVLRRYLQQAGESSLPDDLAGYLHFMTRVLEQNQQHGGIAIKFEAAYFRSLYFEDPPRSAAAALYAKYRRGGVPSAEEYKTFQDFVFRYLVSEAGRLGLAVHFHSAVGIGDYFSFHNGSVLNLENVLRDPRYANVTFVLIHGGYPFYRQAIWLAAVKNVYLDSSETSVLLYPSELKHVLKLWLETYPEKITFGSDAFPYNDALGVEESYWLAINSSRTALAAALAEMIADGEITEAKALEYAHAYLHDTAARLYPAAKAPAAK